MGRCVIILACTATRHGIDAHSASPEAPGTHSIGNPSRPRRATPRSRPRGPVPPRPHKSSPGRNRAVSGLPTSRASASVGPTTPGSAADLPSGGTTARQYGPSGRRVDDQSRGPERAELRGGSPDAASTRLLHQSRGAVAAYGPRNTWHPVSAVLSLDFYPGGGTRAVEDRRHHRTGPWAPCAASRHPPHHLLRAHGMFNLRMKSTFQASKCSS